MNADSFTDFCDYRSYDSAEFHGRLRAVGLRVWSDSAPPTEVVLGVAPYSRLEMELLDELSKAQPSLKEKLAVFDLTQVHDMSGLEHYIPGITPAFQSPVIGIWRNGQVQERLSGSAARQRMQQLVESYGR